MRRAWGWTVSAFGIGLLAASLLTVAGCGDASLATDQENAYGHRRTQSVASPNALAQARAEARRAAALGRSAPADEVWVIARADGEVEATGDYPGTGSMVYLPDPAKPDQRVPVPLKHTSVDASVSAYIATVDVNQQFHNPFDSKIEAVYVFPLPQNAAVNEFVMTIGERRVRGIIREREEAERVYKEARAQGYVASLLTQERPNVFTQKVANIEPGKAIDVNIRYLHTLGYEDGWYEFVFPMVVGPRFNPPDQRDGVGAVARGNHGLSGQSTEVQHLAPHERSGHAVDLSVTLDAGVGIEQVTSVNHRIDEQRLSPTRRVVSIAKRDRLPNKDFVLRWRVAGERIKASLLTQRTERGGYFTLMLYPPKVIDRLERRPMEMIFVLDCSGSMSGKPIGQAKDAIRHGLSRLGPDDTFQVIRFSTDSSAFGPRPVHADPEALRKADRYVRDLRGSGGTMMIEGVRAALDFPHEPGRGRVVSFMTDGFIGNDDQIIAAVERHVGASRVFSFGVGASPNRYLMNRMAKAGRGAVAYLSLNDDGGAVMGRFFERVSHPALTGLSVNWGGMRVGDVYPRKLPDLFVGRPVILTGRYDGELPDEIVVRGQAGRRAINIVVPTGNEARTHDGVAAVWARSRIADLYGEMASNPSHELATAIKQTALDYGLMSAYTAFVAVDSSQRTAGTHGTTVAVPVPVPDGVKYETTVQQ